MEPEEVLALKRRCGQAVEIADRVVSEDARAVSLLPPLSVQQEQRFEHIRNVCRLADGPEFDVALLLQMIAVPANVPAKSRRQCGAKPVNRVRQIDRETLCPARELPIAMRGPRPGGRFRRVVEGTVEI